MIYSKGEPLRKVKTEELVDVLFEEIDKYYERGKVVEIDEAAAAEAAQWLAENEDETAMTPERLAAMEKAAAQDGPDITAPSGPSRLDEKDSPVEGRRFKRPPNLAA
jgi:(E)-4-hydroxy-3-methylbut-2-enyl-diphosphate synthase